MMKPNKIIQEVFGSESRIEVDEVDKEEKDKTTVETLYADNKEVLKIYGR